MSSSKVMVIIFFTGDQMFTLNALPKGRKFNQDSFLEEVLPSVPRQRTLPSMLWSTWIIHCAITLGRT
jgi:hypothetical protein